MIIKLADGKHQVSWPVATITLPNGHTLTGRPATIEALTGASVHSSGEVFKIGTLAECQRQEA